MFSLIATFSFSLYSYVYAIQIVVEEADLNEYEAQQTTLRNNARQTIIKKYKRFTQGPEIQSFRCPSL